MSSDIKWEWLDDGGWIEYDAETTRIIETAYAAQQKTVVLNNGFFRAQGGYEIDFRRMTQKKKRTGFDRRVRRSGPAPGTRPSPARAQQLEQEFAKYKDPDSPPEAATIGPEGIELLCRDMGIDPADPVIFVVAQKMEAEKMYIFTKKEFMKGFEALGLSSPSQIRQALPQLRRVLEEMPLFTPLYRYVFKYSCEPGKRTLPVDVAVGIWRLLLLPKFPRLMERFLEYLQHARVPQVSLDLWNTLLAFLQADHGANFSTYDTSGAWPNVLDEFVEWCRKPAEATPAAAH
ncbi:putative defective in Cullin neddylation protein 1 [Paratrimastix pyriformis]|uniref:Defective in cullin neddylation protein n=1 Tax=Paratrimastix pyriformis TaxID=342808 RepID=A0ABQ8UZF0_9EUKA|nr:putative defective in Cullin neddylation protein 1 [Paratrimastix pyriformis]